MRATHEPESTDVPQEPLVEKSSAHTIGESRLPPIALSRTDAWKILAISAAVLIPCFWHRRIEACDLGSHVYNAWLATLIEQGKAPGLLIVHPWNNVLFDVLLTRLGSVLGWVAAERIAVSLAVLVFFWGSFSLLRAASGRAPWMLTPAIAMAAYGWAFHIGFFNYYLSLGLAFWSAALLWRGRGKTFWIGVALAPLVLLAHPIGLAWLAGAIFFVKISEALPKWWRILPLAAAAIAIVLARTYLMQNYSVQWARTPIPLTLMNGLNGVDQLVLGARYKTLARGVFLLGAGCFLADCIWRTIDGRRWREISIPLQLYTLALFATALLPDRITFPQYAVPFGFILTRLSLVSAVMALCILACMRLTKFHFAVFSAVALFFFTMVYQDTSTIDHMERQTELLVRQLPPGQRVTATIWPLPQSRLYFIEHVVDEACIGRCFSYFNYEPASKQFRIRVQPGSPIVAATSETAGQMETGDYIVRAADLPLEQIYQCDATFTKLCMRELHAGEKTGRIGLNTGP